MPLLWWTYDVYHFKSEMMMSVNQNHRTKQLALTGKLLSLGQAIIHLDMATDSDPYVNKQVSETPKELMVKIDSLTEDLQKSLLCDGVMRPIRKLLNHFPRTTPAEQLWIISLVAHGMSALSPSLETADSVSMKAAKLFDSDKIVGMLSARQVIGNLIKNNILKLEEEALCVCGTLRGWLAGRCEYASWGINEKEADFYKKNNTNKRIYEHRGASSESNLKSRVKDIPLLNPQECFDEIGNHGYIGQESARRSISLAAYRHVLRLRRIHLDEIPSNELPPREHALLIGGTGSGKSYLIKTLFENVLKLPTAISDATTMTSVGYVGEDVSIILHKLMQSAEGKQDWAQCGISAIDECDKIASAENNASFGGEGSRNSVATIAVQNGLLKIIEENGSVIDISSEYGVPVNKGRGRIAFNTSNVLFMALGAFSGMDLICKTKPTVGFGGNGGIGKKSIPQHDINQLAQYGICRELLGRFNSIIHFDPLSESQLMEILERNTIRRYARELELSGIELVIDDSVRRRIVQKALARDTGARGLSSELCCHLNDACFNAYSASRPVKSIRLFVSRDYSVDWDIKHQYVRKKKTEEAIEQVA